MSAVMTETRRNGVPAEVHALLTLWGNWTRRMKLGPSGYPPESPFVKAALFGKLGLPQQSNVRLDQESMPALVEWMDKIVEALPPDLNEIIVAKYRPKVDLAGNEMRPEQMARSLGMSVSTFRNRLEGAQWYVFAKMYP